MLDTLLSGIAPHACVRCGAIANGLCVSCKKSVHVSILTVCVYCGGVLQDGCCWSCQLAGVCQSIPFVYQAEIKQLLQEYKFSYRRAYAQVLAELLDRYATLPAGEAMLVPLPTAPAHVRERGFDHTLNIVRHLAKIHSTPYDALLVRTKNFRQVGATRLQRHTQVVDAYHSPVTLPADITYVVVDDVVTTGASISAGVAALQKAGAVRIGLLAIARQPLG